MNGIHLDKGLICIIMTMLEFTVKLLLQTIYDYIAGVAAEV